MSEMWRQLPQEHLVPTESLYFWDRSQSDLLRNEPLWKAVATMGLKQIQAESTQLRTVSQNNVPVPLELELERGLVERGGEGESILHIAILKQRPVEVIEWIVKTYPVLVNEPYRGDRYCGETALHLAVVQCEDHDPADETVKSVVRLLLDAGADVNRYQAIGREFSAEDKATLRYYGQTVLQFAAVSGKPKIVEYLCNRTPADTKVVDQVTKNNVLHLLAKNKGLKKHDFRRMFQFLKNVNPNLLNQLNEANQTPLGVGLSEGNVNVLEAVKDVLWDFDKVCRYRVPLNELDPLFNRDDSEVGKNVLLNLYQSVKKAFSEESEKKHASLIEMAVYHHDKDIICHPVIDTILRYKWKLYAQYFFLGRFVTALVNVLLFFTPAVAMQPNTLADRRHYDLTNSHVDKVRLAFEILTILGTLYTFFVSWHDTFKKYNLITNITRWSFGLLVFFVPLIRLFAVDESVGLNAENVCIGIAAIIGWIHLVRFARGFEAVGPLIEVVTQICFKDFFQWLVIYIPLTVGFGTALFLQMQTAGARAVEAGNVLAEDWDTNFGAVLSAVRFQFQQEQYSDFQFGGIPGFAIALFMTYGFLATLLLANILISKLVDTFERIHDDANREWKLDLARLILSIDLRLTPDQKTKYLKDFGFEVDEKNAIAQKGNEKVKVLQFTERRHDEEDEADEKLLGKKGSTKGERSLKVQVLQVVVGRTYPIPTEREKYDDVTKSADELRHFRGFEKEWKAFLVFIGFRSAESAKILDLKKND